jgi:uncharacterized phage infection (PIP) family protein YhgE
MALKVKDPTTVANKWSTRAQGAVNDYKAGVQAPKASQSAMAIAAAPLWQQAVNSPQALASFQSGLRAAGDAGWQAGALNKGAARYPGGITAGLQKFTANITPFLNAIAGLNLPAKGLRGSAANIQRVAAVAEALHSLKLQRSGSAV